MHLALSQLVPAIAIAFALAGPAMAASTAKAALKEVTAASKQWQPDAVLTHVTTLKATASA